MEALFDVPVWYILSKKYVFSNQIYIFVDRKQLGATDAPDRVTLGILSQREPRAFQG